MSCRQDEGNGRAPFGTGLVRWQLPKDTLTKYEQRSSMVAFANKSPVTSDQPVVSGLDRPGHEVALDPVSRGAGLERPVDDLVADVAEQINARFSWWGGKYGKDLTATAAELSIICAFFGGGATPAGVSLTDVPARAEIWKNASSSMVRPLLLASMAQYRALNDVTGSIETNPFALPPVDFLLRTLNDERTSASTKELCHFILQQGNGHHLYQLNREQRHELVRALQQDLSVGALDSAALATMAAFNIKRDELIVATSPVSATPMIRASVPPPLPEAALKA